MQLTNATPGAHAAVPTRDATGREVLLVVLVLAFEVDAAGSAARVRPEEAPSLVDVHRGPHPGASSLVRASELAVGKPGTDVVLLGHAHAPRGARTTSVVVELAVGPVRKALRAFGPRAFVRDAFGRVVPGAPAELREPVPLVWERAYGGGDLRDAAHPLVEARNPVGLGVARDASRLVGTRAYDLEPVDGRPIEPVGFGPIARHWAPRGSFAGTYDAAWRATRMPFSPLDFDPRFHVTVPHDQWAPTPLRGDERVRVRGATPEGTWSFALPRIAPGFASLCDGVRSSHATHLDTLRIDADTRRVELTYRAAIPLPAKYERLERVTIVEKAIRALGAPRDHAPRSPA